MKRRKKNSEFRLIFAVVLLIPCLPDFRTGEIVSVKKKPISHSRMRSTLQWMSRLTHVSSDIGVSGLSVLVLGILMKIFLGITLGFSNSRITNVPSVLFADEWKKKGMESR